MKHEESRREQRSPNQPQADARKEKQTRGADKDQKHNPGVNRPEDKTADDSRRRSRH